MKEDQTAPKDSTQQMITEPPTTIPEAQCKCHFFQEALLDVPVESTPSSPQNTLYFKPSPAHIPTLFPIHRAKRLNVFLTIGLWRAGARLTISVCTVEA